MRECAVLRIGIVGGGAAGVLVAGHVLKQAAALGRPVGITVVEPRERLGEGIAYSTNDPLHLLNVRAGGMSALADQPDHFRVWAGADDAEFLPRASYAPYLRDFLAGAEGKSGQIEHVRKSATGLWSEQAGVRLATDGDDGPGEFFDRVVIATGNRFPALPSTVRLSHDAAALVSLNPWLAGPAVAAGSRLLVIGSGLSAVDAVVSLLTRDLSATAVMVSRHGLLPARHQLPGLPVTPPITEAALADGLSLSDALRAFREAGDDWRPLVDSLRSTTPQLWQALGQARQEQFARHLRRLWDVHRHRMAPQIADSIDTWLAEGRLRVEAASINAIDLGAGGVRVLAADGREWEADRVVVATGPADAVSGCPLLGPLVTQGRVVPGSLGWGVSVEADSLRPLNPSGEPWRSLYVVGPPNRGTLLESTAVPEIRVQAASIAASLLAG